MSKDDHAHLDADKPVGMRVSLMSEFGKMRTIWLHGKPQGRYHFANGNDGISEFFYIEAKNEKWYACCNEPAVFEERDGKTSSAAELYDQCLLSVGHLKTGGIIYAETFSQSSSVFHNYQVKRPSEINIGRTDDNDIAYPTAYVSKRHATIRLSENGDWTVQDRGNRDEGSVNGVFVNGERIRKRNERGMITAPLKVGDTVDIMCARIIIGIDFISVNVDENRIRIVSAEKLKRVSSTDLMGFPNMPSHPQKNAELFNRLPRRRIALEPSTIEIKAPPVSLNSNDIPMLLRMGGPVVMSGASVLAGHFTMMISSVLFPVLTQRYTEKQRKEYEIRRNSRYKAYLNAKSIEIQKELRTERSILCANYPELSEVLKYAETGKKLWERRKTDDDFLSLRLGSGKLPLMASLSYPPRDFEMEEDPLLEEMYALAETKVYLEHVPVMNSFVENFVCGVLGRRDIALFFIKGLIMQLAMLHSYDEVKLIFLSSENELEQLEFVRYLPHIWNDQKDFRFLAVNAEEAYQIGEYLSSEIGEDLVKQRELKQILKNRPYYVVVALDKKIFDGMEVLKDVMQADQNCGVSVLAVFDDLPKECIKIFDLYASGEHSVVYLKQIDKEDDSFQADRFDFLSAEQSMRTISNINLRVISQAYSLPKSVSFLEMYDVGRVKGLNVSKRWDDSNSEKSLSAPIGIDTSGSLFTLDLHEKFQGPHGLVAGMTGSGKSEFIISYILSMAVNFPPDDIAFVLIDYKGGGLAGAFEDESRGIHLPHVVGTITNLDGSSIQRSLMSIQSELKRRQEIFNKAKSLFDEGTMDIYVYQKLYHIQKKQKKEHSEEPVTADKRLEPLPHLFIISDEFAELKKQEPEFMDQLISAARIGRSLGVHLILATQKPSGVVDDQIWSNTKFRVCLRVQDRGDSFEMLKRPEAAELRDTGRFYLQVGYNEYFALGQSAYCGADYIPQDEVVVQKDDEIQMVDSIGRSILAHRPHSGQYGDESKKVKQLTEIVNHISAVAKEKNIRPRLLWTEPLRKQIDLDDLIEEYRITRGREVEAIIGQVDDPAHQKQFPLIMNLHQSRNLLIAGESGSGKTTMLQTILYYVSTHYSPEDVHFYILDFSSRNLSIFKNLPHCGAFLTDEHEDKLDSMFALIREIIDERRKLFAQAEVSSFDAYREIASLPLILFIIDNVSQFEENYQRRNTLGELMCNGVGYGVKTIFTISQINDCPMRLRREAGNKIALRARDRYAYSDILDCRCRYEPVDTPGRGICVIEKECYEFQTALAFSESSEKSRMEQIRVKLNGIPKNAASGFQAKQLEMADKNQEYTDFMKSFSMERVPVGYSLQSGKKISIPLQQLHCVSLYFGQNDSASMILENFIRAAKREQSEIFIVKRDSDSIFAQGSALHQRLQEWESVTILDCSSDGIQTLIAALNNTRDENKGYRDQYCAEHHIEDKERPEALRAWRKEIRRHTHPVMVFFESFLDVGLHINLQVAGQISGYFQFGAGFNIYFWAGFYADDENRFHEIQYPNGDSVDVLSGEDEQTTAWRQTLSHVKEQLSGAFNPDKFSLLFGGHFDKQTVVNLDFEWQKVGETYSARQAFNKLLLCYHNKVREVIMPCGDITAMAQDPDEEEIV